MAKRLKYSITKQRSKKFAAIYNDNWTLRLEVAQLKEQIAGLEDQVSQLEDQAQQASYSIEEAYNQAAAKVREAQYNAEQKVRDAENEASYRQSDLRRATRDLEWSRQIGDSFGAGIALDKIKRLSH